MRRVRRKGANKDKVFGCDLLAHLNASSQEIPQVLRCCTDFVETHGVVDGIYRLSGVSSNTQKLRTEFESDGSPDLNKDLYLQDIHCVSSLCKAYFRELPNPLLTYQLYDKFAEAVSIQLEEERLVKIRDVLKELPTPHYRTLEFLMRHLVRMASYSSETNMHARNLAIVWAPNLLRSKDIEVCGFNGKAAFMEVRVQSIVVEFILTHVPQLFPEPGSDSEVRRRTHSVSMTSIDDSGLPHSGVSCERRTSLPSPTAACNQEEGFFKSTPTQPLHSFGNISPGDGPLPIRPYHAIIEGTDKRKGSLKGRRWMSIFNIGGRFHDRRQKHSSKEKDRPVLRPARSMDSLSTLSYPKDGSLHSTQSPPSTNTSTKSPLVTPSTQSGSDVTVYNSAMSGSEYAVTYRRGTGLVSGGLGTQGTYTALDPEGYGVTGNETLQMRSPGLTNKGRRAAMHISGPTMVTVPLHITSNLALGVLLRGGGDRVIHRGRDKDEGDRIRGKEGRGKVQMRESKGMEWKVEDSRKVEEEGKNDRVEATDRDVMDTEGNAVERGDGEEEGEREEEEEKEDVREGWSWEPGMVIGGGGVCREPRDKSQTSSNEEDNNEDEVNEETHVDKVNEYMAMKGAEPADFHPEVNECEDVCSSDASDIFNSTEVEEGDLELSGYVQDNFEFLDQMDYSALDHLDCSVPYQVIEFSVEPPCLSDDEYEVMEQAEASHPAELQTHLQPGPEAHTQSQTELNPSRLLSVDSHSRHTKSLSLPHITSPVHGPEESYSEEEAEDDSDDNDYSSEDDESMFVKSLPADFLLNSFGRFEPDTDTQDSCALDRDPAHQSQISGGREYRSLSCQFPACKESTAGDPERVEVNTNEDEDRKVETELTKVEEDIDCKGKDQLEDNRQSGATEEEQSVEEDSQNDKNEGPSSEASTPFCADDPLPSTDESSAGADVTIVEREVVDNQHSDRPPCHALSRQKESTDTPFEESSDFSVSSTKQPRTCVREDVDKRDSDEGEDMQVYKGIEDMCQEMVQEITENDQNTWEEPKEDGNKSIPDTNLEEKMQECGKEQDNAICRASSEICNEHKDVLGEVVEEEDSEQVERRGARESVAKEEDMMEHVTVGGEEQIVKVSGDETVDVDEGHRTKETEDGTEVVEESREAKEENLTVKNMQQQFEENGTTGKKTSEPAEAIQGKCSVNNEAQRHEGKDVVSEGKDSNDKEKVSEQRGNPSSVALLRPEMKVVKEGRKHEESTISHGGVGRKLVISRNPKVFQVRAVPVVPPKPQHCVLTTLTYRIPQQQQQRERGEGDGREGSLVKVPTEHDTVCAGDQGRDGDEGRGQMEKPTTPTGGEIQRERRRDGEERASRATSRNSPLSMCFDEAVAIATMRREKEKECEKERKRDWGNEV